MTPSASVLYKQMEQCKTQNQEQEELQKIHLDVKIDHVCKQPETKKHFKSKKKLYWHKNGKINLCNAEEVIL